MITDGDKDPASKKTLKLLASMSMAVVADESTGVAVDGSAWVIGAVIYSLVTASASCGALQPGAHGVFTHPSP